MSRMTIDTYVVDTLMRDLVEHDKKPSAFVVYLHLWSRTQGATRAAKLSHLKISDATGLSKSSVQIAIQLLQWRKLIRVVRSSSTAVPEYTVLRPWARGN